MVLQAGDHITLGHITGVDQHQAEFLIADRFGPLADRVVLRPGNDLALMQDRPKTIFLIADLGISQFAIAESDPGGLVGPLYYQGAGFLRQIYQIEQLGDCKIS